MVKITKQNNNIITTILQINHKNNNNFNGNNSDENGLNRFDKIDFPLLFVYFFCYRWAQVS